MRRRTATYPRALRVNQVLRQVVAEELERLADADELPHGHGDLGRHRRRTCGPPWCTSPRWTRRRPWCSRSAGSTCSASSGAQMTMKRTPRLTFRADPAIVAGSRVEELLRGLHEGEPPVDEP